MKIAISTDNDFVSAHFGRCAAYTIAELQGDQILSTEKIANPGHRPGFLPQFLSDRGVSCIICGGMGRRAELLFHERGIDTIVGVTGTVDQAIRSFAEGHLRGGESLCERTHGDDHGERECRHDSKERG